MPRISTKTDIERLTRTLASWRRPAAEASPTTSAAAGHGSYCRVVNTEPLTAQRLCRAESAPRLAVVAAASGAIEVPHVIADDARLGERGVRRRYARCPQADPCVDAVALARI